VIAGWTAPPTTVTITVGKLTYATVACSIGQVEPFFWLYWPVTHLSGSVTTSQFGVANMRPNGHTIAPNVTAPPPSTSTPCNTPTLLGINWFAILLDNNRNVVATFPVGGNSWNTGTSDQQSVLVGGWITVFLGGDITGTNDTLSVFGTGGSSVTVVGNTSVGPYISP
jgi:hypothetical protein